MQICWHLIHTISSAVLVFNFNLLPWWSIVHPVNVKTVMVKEVPCFDVQLSKLFRRIKAASSSFICLYENVTMRWQMFTLFISEMCLAILIYIRKYQSSNDWAVIKPAFQSNQMYHMYRFDFQSRNQYLTMQNSGNTRRVLYLEIDAMWVKWSVLTFENVRS